MKDVTRHNSRAPRRADPRARRRVGRAHPARGLVRGGVPRRALRRPPARRRRATRPPQPDARPRSSPSIHDAYFAAGADIATTNTFTATSIGQADYALEGAAAEMNVEGARLARAAADAWTARRPRAAVRRRLGRPAERHAVALAEGRRRRPSAPSRSTRSATRTRSRSRRSRDGGVDLLLIETIFDTLNAKAAIVAAQRRRARAAALALVHGDRHAAAATSPARPSRRSGSRSSTPSRSSSASTARSARPRCGRSSRGSRASRRRTCRCHPNAGLPNALGLHDEQPARHEPLPARVRRGRARQPRRRLLRHDARAHATRSPRAVEGLPPRRVPARSTRPRFSRPRAVRDRPGHRLRRWSASGRT